ncbi:hypothetical protein GCM10011374_29700 [Kocuria dechangensis]|uniref:SLH domain-containing protein n=1 Tax=Kocuria dechangensis TaxID=1176249 RepID=A0A917LXT2_9MICC|nr:hypothetical protein GCM10011374_29700 [Kocuria dechangensis]
MRTSIRRALVAAPTATLLTVSGLTGALAVESAPAPESTSVVTTASADGWDWRQYERGDNVTSAEILNQVNCLRAVAGVQPVAVNTTLSALAQAAADLRAGRGTGSTTPGKAPSGGTYHGQVQSSRYFNEEDLRSVNDSPGLREKLTDPRTTHVGIGRAYSPQMDEEGWWSEHVVVDLWQYPAGAAVPGTVASTVPDCPDHWVPPAVSPFKDVTTTQQFYKEMAWLADRKISTGWVEADGSRTYRPLQTIKRDAMAAFLYRMAGSPDYTPPKVSPFKDVTTTQQFYKEMAWLAENRISTGWDDGTYRPGQTVNRDAMAAFLYRLAAYWNGGYVEHTPPVDSPFTDVSPGQQFYAEMTWLAANEISTGWDDGSYRALLPVNRDAMAAFLFRLDGYHRGLTY